MTVQDALRHLSPYRAHLAATVAALALGATVAGLRIAAMPAKSDVQDRWTLPVWTPYKAANRADVIANSLWGEDADRAPKADAEKKEVPPWRFIGTIQDGRTLLAVIEIEGKRIARMKSGEDLPNGAKITAVVDGRLSYDEGGVAHTIKLFDAAARKQVGAPNP